MLKILVLFVLALIVVSLGSALIGLLRHQDEGARTARALTLRIALSIALFAALLLAGHLGIITPHGLQDGWLASHAPPRPTP